MCVYHIENYIENYTNDDCITEHVIRMRKKPYPSQIRYYRKNPVVSFRLPAEEKQRLEDIAREKGMTLSQLFKSYYDKIKATDEELREELRKKNETELKKEYDRGYEEGYKKAEEDWKIDFECSICFKKMYIRPNTKIHYAIKDFLRSKGWGHAECIDGRKRA